MKKRIVELSEKIEKYLSELQNEYDDRMEVARKATTFLAEQIEALQGFISGYAFPDEAEEIEFFRHINPEFYSKYIYYQHICHIEGSRRPGVSPGFQQGFLTEEVNRIDRFFRQHLAFITYYNNGFTHRDIEYFTRSSYDPNQHLEEYSLFIHCSSCTLYSYRIAQIQAYGSLQAYLTQALEEIIHPEQLPAAGAPEKSLLTWTAPKAALIELAYALGSSGVFNFGRTDVKQVVRTLESCFNIKLGNFYRVFQGQRIRKKSRTSFLDALKENLIRRMDETDLNPKGI